MVTNVGVGPRRTDGDRVSSVTPLAVVPRDEVLRRTRAVMEAQGIDALVAHSNANTFFTAGTAFLVQRIGGKRLGLAVTFRDGDQVFIYERTEVEHAKTESWVPNLREYVEFTQHPIDVLADVLSEHGVDRGRVGVEMLFMSTKEYEILQRRCPSAQLIDADPVFQRLRAVKTPEEFQLLSELALTTVRAIRSGLQGARVGDAEIEIAERIKAAARAMGMSQWSHLNLASGPNAQAARHEPDGTKLVPSSVVRVDFGVVSRHYPSDIARTAIVGPALPEQLETYKKLEAIFAATVGAVRPGMPANSVFQAFASASGRARLEPALGHVGHSISINLENRHEAPVLQPLETTVLEPGMVFAVSPMVIGPEARYHVEDLVEVTASGARVRSRPPDWDLAQPMVIG